MLTFLFSYRPEVAQRLKVGRLFRGAKKVRRDKGQKEEKKKNKTKEINLAPLRQRSKERKNDAMTIQRDEREIPLSLNIPVCVGCV